MNEYNLISEALLSNEITLYHMSDKKNIKSILKYGLSSKFSSTNYSGWFKPIVDGIYTSSNLPYLLKIRDQEILITCIANINSILIDEDIFKVIYGSEIIRLLGYNKLKDLSTNKLIKHEDYVKDLVLLHNNPNHKEMISKIKSIKIIPTFTPSNKETISIIKSITTSELSSLIYHHKNQGNISNTLNNSKVKIDVNVLRKGLKILVKNSNPLAKKQIRNKVKETTYIIPEDIGYNNNVIPHISKIELVKNNKVIKETKKLNTELYK
jgi:hypothetical protein